MSRAVCIFVVFLMSAGVLSSAGAQGSDPYRIVQTAKADKGELRILEDGRLDRAVERELWKTCVDPAFALGEKDPRAKPFVAKPLIPAKLQQVGSDGRVLADIVIDEGAPIARIDSKRIGSRSDPTFMVEINNNACFGSYSGTAYWLYHFDHGRLARLTAQSASGEQTPIVLLSRLKSAWRFVRNTPSDIKIELVRCDPDNLDATPSALPFNITYITYQFDGSKWTWAKRSEPGFWENERNNFPPHGKFP